MLGSKVLAKAGAGREQRRVVLGERASESAAQKSRSSDDLQSSPCLDVSLAGKPGRGSESTSRVIRVSAPAWNREGKAKLEEAKQPPRRGLAAREGVEEPGPWSAFLLFQSSS